MSNARRFANSYLSTDELVRWACQVAWRHLQYNHCSTPRNGAEALCLLRRAETEGGAHMARYVASQALGSLVDQEQDAIQVEPEESLVNSCR
jgi:hypothetical protein